MHGLVGEPWRPHHVADGVDAGCARAVPFVYDDMPALDLNAVLFEAQAFDVAGDADGEDDAAGLDVQSRAAGCAQPGSDAGIGVAKLLDRCACMDRHALSREGLARELGYLFVFGGQDAIQDFHDSDVHAKGAIEACELDPNRARPNHEQRPWKVRRHHRFLVGPDAYAVGLETWKTSGPRAGGYDDVFRRDRRQDRAVRSGQTDAVGPFEPPCRIEHRNLVLLHEKSDAVGQLFGHGPAALDDPVEIEAETLDAETEDFGLGDLPVELGGAQERLGGNAAPVQADAPEMLPLDDRRPHAELGGANGGHVTARSAADNDEIEFRIAHDVEANPSNA